MSEHSSYLITLYYTMTNLFNLFLIFSCAEVEARSQWLHHRSNKNKDALRRVLLTTQMKVR